MVKVKHSSRALLVEIFRVKAKLGQRNYWHLIWALHGCFIFTALMIKQSAWFIFFLLVGVSCLDEPDCFSLNNDIVGITFRKLSDRQPDTVNIQSIKTIVNGAEVTFALNPAVRSTRFTLPINYFTDQTTFTISYNNKADHALTLRYKSQPQFVSQDCGNRFVITELSAEGNSFDSVRVINNVPGRRATPASNVDIYRCPNRSIMKVRFAADAGVQQITTVGYTGYIHHVINTARIYSIPLDTTRSTSTIRFRFADQSEKEMVVAYTRQRQTLFNTCGPQTVLSQLELVSSGFSQVTRVNRNVLDPARINFEITN